MPLVNLIQPYLRIKILDNYHADGEMVYKVVVKCIDVGSKLIIDTKDLIRLPSRFGKLPPQVLP